MPGSYKVLLSIALFSIAALHGAAQNYTVKLHFTENDTANSRMIKDSMSFTKEENALEYMRGVVSKLQTEGFLAAALDSIGRDQVFHAYVYKGTRYEWGALDYSALPPEFRNQGTWSNKSIKDDPVSLKKLNGQIESVLAYYENNGYPFAYLYMDSSRYKDGKLYGILKLEKGDLFRIDTLLVEGTARLSRSFLLRYLGIKEGEVYNEQKLQGISKKIAELEYVKEPIPWTFRYSKIKSQLTIHLVEKSANQLNALVGLLPNNSETGKLLFTVDALFAFQNIFGFGEQLNFSYKNLQPRSPRLKAGALLPYLYQSPLAFDGNFELFKRDSQFRRTTYDVGIRYLFSSRDYIKVFYTGNANRLISIDTAYLITNKRLPENVDVIAAGAGAEAQYNKTDFALSPRKGVEFKITGARLNRKLIRNDAILGLVGPSGFEFAGLYDTLQLRSIQYNVSGFAATYIPIGKRSAFKVAYTGGYLSGKQLFRNELFQIGGFKILRGFDEQSIYASQYHMGTLEYRLFLDKVSYAYLFTDNAFVVSSFSGYRTEALYSGFGAGISLRTRTGLFSLGYALGKSPSTEIQFRQSKIHFGYIAYF